MPLSKENISQADDMETHPIDLYLEANESFKRGDKSQAAEKLSQALGSEKTTEPIKSAIDKFLSKETRAHEIALRLLEAEVGRKQSGK